MKHFFFRQTHTLDIGFYAECFQSREFQNMLYGDEQISLNFLKKYIQYNADDLKFICALQTKEGESVNVGFAHFYHKEQNIYTYVGGIHPKYFNTGIGVYASVAVLDLLYDLKNDSIIKTGVYKYNTRSFKMLQAIGFVVSCDTNDKTMMELSPDSFNNKFVEILKSKISYTYI